VTVAGLNALPPEEAERELLACCGSRAWARRMAALRPFASPEEVREAAERVWWGLAPEDWREAFRSHPRIGEQKGAQPERGARWSAEEQAGVRGAEDAVRAALAAGNHAYEARFGHLYIVCATGKGADEMLEILHARLDHDPDTELRVAAGEQAKITRLRLEKLLSP
jgi:OHCU decarboxylase